MRGRDIKKYGHNYDDLWIINSHNGIKEKGIKPINIDDFPIVKNHLDQYYEQLEKRSDKGDTAYNLRNCAYMDDFSKQKIIYPEITKFLNFYFDDSGFFANNKCFILSGKNLYYLISFFNSSLFKYAFKDDFPELLGGSRELRKVFIEQIPIVEVDEKTNLILKELVLKCQNLNDDNFSKKEIEKKIDNIIFNHFDLTQDEIDAIGFIEIR